MTASPAWTVLDGRPDCVHPAGVLVTECVGQRDVALGRPLALDDVEVGAAEPGPAHSHDDVEGAESLWGRGPPPRRSSWRSRTAFMTPPVRGGLSGLLDRVDHGLHADHAIGEDERVDRALDLPLPPVAFHSR